MILSPIPYNLCSTVFATAMEALCRSESSGAAVVCSVAESLAAETMLAAQRNLSWLYLAVGSLSSNIDALGERSDVTHMILGKRKPETMLENKDEGESDDDEDDDSDDEYGDDQEDDDGEDFSDEEGDDGDDGDVEANSEGGDEEDGDDDEDNEDDDSDEDNEDDDSDGDEEDENNEEEDDAEGLPLPEPLSKKKK